MDSYNREEIEAARKFAHDVDDLLAVIAVGVNGIAHIAAHFSEMPMEKIEKFAEDIRALVEEGKANLEREYLRDLRRDAAREASDAEQGC